jgi:hypothetical protein
VRWLGFVDLNLLIISSKDTGCGGFIKGVVEVEIKAEVEVEVEGGVTR